MKKIIFLAVAFFVVYQVGAWNALRPTRAFVARLDAAEEARREEMDAIWAAFLEVPKDFTAPAAATIGTPETVLGGLTDKQRALFIAEVGPRMNWMERHHGLIAHRQQWRFWPAVIDKLDDM